MLYEGNNQTVEKDRVEILRLILEREQERTVTRDEAAEVAESLISFFEILVQEGEQIL